MVINNISHIKQADSLVTATKCLEIKWVKAETLKAYLRNDDKSLNMIPIFQEYLVHLQDEKFVFDCSETYFSLFNNTLFAFAKGRNLFTYRLDSKNLETDELNKCKWELNKAPTSILLRIRNAIEIVSTTVDEKVCSDLLTTISSENLV